MQTTEPVIDFSSYCKEYIKNKLPDYEGAGTTYGAELAYYIMQDPNMDGTLTYSRRLAIGYLKEWWDDAADFFEYEKSNFGEASNPFENPEAYMVRMVIYGVEYLLGQCPSVVNKWNWEINITPKLISAVIGDIESMGSSPVCF